MLAGRTSTLFRQCARPVVQRLAMTARLSVAAPAQQVRHFGERWTKESMPTPQEREGPKVLEEIEAAEKGIFYAQGPVIGDFGTLEKPARILSFARERTVGCVGDAAGLKHPLMWMSLKSGMKHCCTECGQVFLLVDTPDNCCREVTPAEENLIVD
jgi:uncharacterized Zn-finger protein